MNERDIFLAALEKHDPGERTAYLDDVCAGDAGLRRRVETLLYAHAIAGSFLEHPAVAQAVEEEATQGDFTQPLTPSSDADSAVTQAEQPPTEDLSLDFLQPGQRSDTLGRIGHYEVLEIVGRGGMGVVLKAFDEELGRVVAVKVMTPQLASYSSARQRFRREAKAAAAISHDHVVTIHAVEEADGLPYLVMQYVCGVSLQERLERSGPLELKEVLRIGMQTAAGLAAAHAQGIVHRDVKPANILLENGVERVRITDFGLARAADDASVSQSGVIKGTPLYMAPEQARGETVDHRADLFSLGSVLYAICSGHPPFRASGTMAVLKRVCEEEPRPIQEINPDVPDWLCAIVEKLHAKRPEDRFQSAKEVAELLEQHLAHLQQPSKVPMPPAVEKPQAPQPVQPTPSDEGMLARGIRFALAAAGIGFAAQLLLVGYWATRGRLFHWAVIGSLGGLALALVIWLTALGVSKWKARAGAPIRWRRLVPIFFVLLLIGLGLLAVPFAIDLFSPRRPALFRLTWDDPETFYILEGKNVRFHYQRPDPEGGYRSFNAGTYTLRGYKRGQVHEEQITLAPGEEIVIHVPGPRRAEADFREIHGVDRQAFDNWLTQIKKEGYIPQALAAWNTVTDEPRFAAAAVRCAETGSWEIISSATVEEGKPKNDEIRDRGYRPQARIMFRSGGEVVVSDLWVKSQDSSSRLTYRGNRNHLAQKLQNARDKNLRPVALCAVWTPPGLFFGHVYAPDNGIRWKAEPMLTRNQLLTELDDQRSRGWRPECLGVYDSGGQWVYLASFIDNPDRVDWSVNLDLTTSEYERELALRKNRGYCPFQIFVREEAGETRYCVLWQGAVPRPPAAEEKRPVPSMVLEELRRLVAVQEENLQKVQLNFKAERVGTLELCAAEVLLIEARIKLALAEQKPVNALLDDLVRNCEEELRVVQERFNAGAVPETDVLAAKARLSEARTRLATARTESTDPELFVLLGKEAKAERKFATLSGAVQDAQAGDVIEIRGDGPCTVHPVEVKVPLTIRVGEGFRPVVTLSPQGVRANGAILETTAPLVLEGLEFHRSSDRYRPPGIPSVIRFHEVAGYVANCRFVVKGECNTLLLNSQDHRAEFRNCDFLVSETTYSAIDAGRLTRGRLTVDNCVLGGKGIVLNYHSNSPPADVLVNLTNNTVVADRFIHFTRWSNPRVEPVPEKPIRVSADGNVVDARGVAVLSYREAPLEPAEAEAALRRLVGWQEGRNLYPDKVELLTATGGWKSVPLKSRSSTLADWRAFWGTAGESLQGEAQFQDPDLRFKARTAPESLRPQHFLLHPSSPGKGKIEDGKADRDLGADVDLVGPGMAYERWKKTKEYEEWRKNVEELMKGAK